jgi:hypothetical protein
MDGLYLLRRTTTMTVTTAAMMPRRMRQQMSTHNFFHRALHASLFACAPIQEENQLK